MVVAAVTVGVALQVLCTLSPHLAATQPALWGEHNEGASLSARWRHHWGLQQHLQHQAAHLLRQLSMTAIWKGRHHHT